MRDEDSVTRRAVVSGAGRLALTGALASALGERSLAAAVPRSSLTRSDAPSAAGAGRGNSGDVPSSEEVFPQSVSSADPTPSGVLVWTRIDPEAYAAERPLYLEVAPDASFEGAARYRIDPAEVDPANDYTVRVDLDGELDPGETYRYRFEYGGVRSRTGRCRTLPASDASPDRLRLAVLTCQDYRNGYYGAYRHLAAADVDFLVHLGDFIYETAGDSPYPGRSIRLPSGADVAMGLADYRHLYRTYRSDPNLRAALERHTLIATWDDHEIVNDRYWDYERDCPGADDHPRADDPGFLVDLFADGVAAWWEYVPTRSRYRPNADRLHDSLQLWRSFRFGDLVELIVTDERFFRSRPPASVGDSQVSFVAGGPPDDPSRTMLGSNQREWFCDRLAASEATWTAWANEVLNGSFRLTSGGETTYNADAWDGYEHERRGIMDALAAGDVENFLALTGDMHSALAGYLLPRYPTDEDEASNQNRLGVEFMAPAVTSANLSQYLDLPSGSAAANLLESVVLRENPHLEFFDSHRWGYGVVEFTPEAVTYEAHAVEKDVDPASADREVFRRLRVPAGSVELRDVTD
ncbi:MAG: alkaline phosphatase [Salinigranum sp.]